VAVEQIIMELERYRLYLGETQDVFAQRIRPRLTGVQWCRWVRGKNRPISMYRDRMHVVLNDLKARYGLLEKHFEPVP